MRSRLTLPTIHNTINEKWNNVDNSPDDKPSTPKSSNSKKTKIKFHPLHRMKKRCRINYHHHKLNASLSIIIIIFFLVLNIHHNSIVSKKSTYFMQNNNNDEIAFRFKKGSTNVAHPPPKSQSRIESNVINTDTKISIAQEDENKQSVSLNDELPIPNALIFTHYTNLLNLPPNETDSELLTLQSNIQNTISLHPNATIRFLTDDDCLRSLANVLGSTHALLKHFMNEKVGMYKADICRGAALYESGGLYFDVDIQARMNILDLIKPETKFVTIQVHSQSKWKGSFFQAFIGATKYHPVLYQYLLLFLDYYEHKLPDVSRGPLGVILLRKAYDRVFMKKDDYLNSTELWQEVRYNHETFPKFLPDLEPTVGKRRACHMVVYIPKTRIVPFYSRVRGSRMCGGKDSD